MNEYTVHIIVRHAPDGQKAGAPDDTVTLSHPIPAPNEDAAIGLAIDMFMLKLFGMGPAFTLQYMKDHEPPDITVTLVEETLKAPAFLSSEETADEPRWRRAN